MLRGWMLWLVVLGSSLVGCQATHGDAAMKPGLLLEAEPASHGLRGDAAAASPAPTRGLVAADDLPAATASPATSAVQRLLIQRGSMRLEVVRPEHSASEFLAEIKALGGYLQAQTGTALTVRLPAASFDEVFASLRGKGRVLEEKREANDVTEEFVDLGIRIDTARKARERLLEVLQKAADVEDILKVEAELRRLTEEIERMEGRKKFLADQVSMATLAVAFVAKVEPVPVQPKQRVRSQFDWINRVGPESLLEDR